MAAWKIWREYLPGKRWTLNGVCKEKYFWRRLVDPKRLVYDLALHNDGTSHSTICDMIMYWNKLAKYFSVWFKEDRDGLEGMYENLVHQTMGWWALAFADSSPIPEESTAVIHSVFYPISWNVQIGLSLFKPISVDCTGKRCWEWTPIIIRSLWSGGYFGSNCYLPNDRWSSIWSRKTGTGTPRSEQSLRQPSLFGSYRI